MTSQTDQIGVMGAGAMGRGIVQIALILAAGMGTRMKSKTIKVLHPILGKPMLQWSVDVAREAGLEPWVVVGHQEELVREAMAGQNIKFVKQDVPRGTGHAVQCALPDLPREGILLVFFGDTPLFRAETLRKLVEFHEGNAATFLSAKLEDAASYGRIVRDSEGNVLRIVEAANASPEELEINEINTGAAVFDLKWLHSVLMNFPPHPPKNEIYLTDALEYASKEGKAGAMILEDKTEADGVNDRVNLAQATKILQQRIIDEHMRNGVSFEDPSSNTVEKEVQIGADSWIGRGALLRGHTKIGEGVFIDGYSLIEDCQIENNCAIHAYSHCFSAEVGTKTSIGPFARLREGTRIGKQARVGNFVEMKKTILGDGAKASHLSYLGDSIVGDKANIGAGTITCNYDGYSKFKTQIGAGAFIGSNSALVAPVSIGVGALVGAGSVITKDVPQDAISVARGVQKNLPNAAIQFRNKREK